VGECKQRVIARISFRPQRGVAGKAGRLYGKTIRREKHARLSPYGGAFSMQAANHESSSTDLSEQNPART